MNPLEAGIILIQWGTLLYREPQRAETLNTITKTITQTDVGKDCLFIVNDDGKIMTVIQGHPKSGWYQRSNKTIFTIDY